MAITQIEIFFLNFPSLSEFTNMLSNNFLNENKSVFIMMDLSSFLSISLLLKKERERERQKQRNALSISTQEKAVEIKLGLI